MKSSIFFVSLLGALALADNTCQCDEPPVCIQSYPESCICEEKAKVACWNKCGGPMPLLTGCPPISTPAPEPQEKCLPEPILCATLHGPRTCECQNAINANKMRCTKIFLPLQDCAAAEAQPQPRDNEVAAIPGTESACLPEPILCATLHGPRTCECQNAINANKMRCTNIFLPLKDCSAPEPQTGDDTCECESTMCAQSWPESCYCENAAKQACYQKCGGAQPVLQTCPSLPSQTLVTLAQKPSDTA